MATQPLGCFSCSLFSLHPPLAEAKLDSLHTSPLPLSSREHQSAKNIEIAKHNVSPEMTNLLQSVLPTNSCSS